MCIVVFDTLEEGVGGRSSLELEDAQIYAIAQYPGTVRLALDATVHQPRISRITSQSLRNCGIIDYFGKCAAWQVASPFAAVILHHGWKATRRQIPQLHHHV